MKRKDGKTPRANLKMLREFEDLRMEEQRIKMERKDGKTLRENLRMEE